MASATPETGSVRLILADAAGGEWSGGVRIRVSNQHGQEVFAEHARYLAPIRFDGLARAPNGLHVFQLQTRYHSPVSFITTVDRDFRNQAIRMLVREKTADEHAHAIRFPAVEELPPALSDLAEEVDPPIAGFPNVRTGTWKEYYAGLVSDRARSHRRIACLLNLFKKMTTLGMGVEVDPEVSRPWDFVQTVFRLEQDRFFAIVKRGLWARMERILGRLRDEPNGLFSAHASGKHNIPMPDGFAKHEVTFKSDVAEKVANLQLSFAKGQVNGEKVWLLDADIDLRTGFAHLVEAAGNLLLDRKTSPYAVHQLMASIGQKPGYDLVVPSPPTAE